MKIEKTKGKWNIIEGLGITSFCYLTGVLSIRVHGMSGFSVMVWVPSGIALAALVLRGLSLWPWVFLASLLVSMSGKTSPFSALAIAAAASIECWVGAYYFLKFAGPKPTLTKLREVTLLMVFPVLLSPLLSATLAVGALFLNGDIPAEIFFQKWRAWWIGSAMGNLILGTFLIAWFNDIRFRLKELRVVSWDAAFLSIAITMICIFSFTQLSSYNHSLIVRPYFLFSLMIYATLRFDLLGTVFTSMMIVITAMIAGLSGFVAFQSQLPEERMVLLQLFTATVASTGLILASVIREKMAAVEARNEFLSIASHELKTPITSLKLQVQLAQRKFANPTEGNEQLSFLKRVDPQINRLVQIIDQLLDASAIERRVIKLHFDDVELSSILKSVLERVSAQLVAAKSTIELVIEPGLRGHWDRFRMEQVFENLISNSIKYAPGSAIRIEAHSQEGMLVAMVQDNGPGIDESIKPAIFERFIRSSKVSSLQGLGLGLFISKQVIEAHGGKISMANVICGTGFRIEVPLLPASSDQLSHERTASVFGKSTSPYLENQFPL